MLRWVLILMLAASPLSWAGRSSPVTGAESACGAAETCCCCCSCDCGCAEDGVCDCGVAPAPSGDERLPDQPAPQPGASNRLELPATPAETLTPVMVTAARRAMPATPEAQRGVPTGVRVQALLCVWVT